MKIDASQTKVFFTGDTHLSHANIIKYCNRPFANATEMDEAIINNWNAKVGPKDVVFHLGDFAFTKKYDALFTRLNGRIYVIRGNHDSDDFVKSTHGWSTIDVLPSLFEVDIRIDGEKTKFVLCHYAMRVWNKSHHGAIHLYGHSHGTLPDDPNARSMDVGVDANNYAPLSLDEVLAHMAKKTFKPIDHHGSGR